MLFFILPTLAHSQVSGRDLVAESGVLLLAVKMEKPVDSLVQKLSILDASVMRENLNSDASKKAFWINIYNAFFQIQAKDKNNRSIFSERSIMIASSKLSLDDIEHGILRRYRAKWSMGYLPKIFVGKTIRSWAVTSLDNRIHFALNCGAKSCAPIAFYTSGGIDQQLDAATKAFLKSETQIDKENMRVETSKLLSWYRSDFGGKRGTMQLLSSVLELDLEAYALSYLEYDWTEKLGNFGP